MKFAHLADVHLGSWGEPKLRELSTKAFKKAIDETIKEKVDFLLIAGDLFNTSLPSIDCLKIAVEKLKELKELNIPVYCIAGSHDYSPSGKTMLEVLEKAGLLINVCKAELVNDKLRLKFTLDPSGAKITGILGKKGMLDKHFYEDLDLEHLENEEGFKIFMLHNELTEYKTNELAMIDSIPLSSLPKNFDYYAAGHIHIKRDKTFNNYGPIIFTGPLFPVTFKELEEQSSGFFIYDNGEINYKDLNIIKTHKIHLNCEHKNPHQIENMLLTEIEGKDFTNTIVLLRLKGILKDGKVSDINFKEIYNNIYEKNAYHVMKNTSKLESLKFEEVKVQSSNMDELEDTLIRENIGQFKIDMDELDLIKELMKSLSTEKQEGEFSKDFEDRVLQEMDKIIGEL